MHLSTAVSSHMALRCTVYRLARVYLTLDQTGVLVLRCCGRKCVRITWGTLSNSTLHSHMGSHRAGHLPIAFKSSKRFLIRTRGGIRCLWKRCRWAEEGNRFFFGLTRTPSALFGEIGDSEPLFAVDHNGTFENLTMYSSSPMHCCFLITLA